MKTKAIVLTMILALLIPFTVSCSGTKHPGVSSEFTSSALTSSEKELGPDEQSGWGEPDDPVGMTRPSFLSVGENGDIFYCDNEGSIYRKLSESNGISKVYASSGYDFVSVEYLSESLICAGYKNSRQQSGYIIFDLKEKTVNNAVWGEEFKEKNIYSLIHFHDSAYFLANPDRYGKYTLYRQTKDKTTELAKGVNEFFILRSRLFYNVGHYIFSINPDGSDIQMLSEAVTHDLLGFTIANNLLFYMSHENTFRVQMFSSGYRKYSERLNVYTCTSNNDYAFFCGAEGGIYAFSFITEQLIRVSDYTASEIICIGDYLYLSPAKPADYPALDEKFIIQNDIYRFQLSELIETFEQGNIGSDLSSFPSVSETSSQSTSSMSEAENPSPVPELFGR